MSIQTRINRLSQIGTGFQYIKITDTHLGCLTVTTFGLKADALPKAAAGLVLQVGDRPSSRPDRAEA